jgi:DNA adenine methylase
MNDSAHRELATALNNAKGLVAISNYECELMDELYPSGKWTKIYGPEKTIHSTKDKRVEVLWVNYEIQEKLIQQNLEL